MSNVFVINQIESTAEKEAHLAWENKAITEDSILSVTSDDAGKIYLNDGLTTNAWKPGTTSSTATFTTIGIGDVNYIGITGVNWESSSASVAIDENGTPIGAASGLRDNQPLFIVFPAITFASKIFNFVFTSSSNLEVGEIAYGETLRLPRNVSVGYGPGRWDTQDIVSTSNTENNQFGRSTVRKRGTTETFTINAVDIDFMENDYVNFIRNATGLPVFFAWSDKSANYGTYGHWKPRKPTFESSFFSSFSLDISGVS